MKLTSLAVFLSQILATSAFAGSYNTFICRLAQPIAGGSSYMLVVENAPAGLDASAVVLEETSGTANPQWRLVSGAAGASQAADGGPLLVMTPAAPLVDWTSDAYKNLCSVVGGYLSFTLNIKGSGIVGSLVDYKTLLANPNKSGCPDIVPANPTPPARELVCDVE